MYFALQAGRECRASMTPPTYTKKPDSDCNSPCKQDTSVMCGSGWRNSVYKVLDNKYFT